MPRKSTRVAASKEKATAQSSRSSESAKGAGNDDSQVVSALALDPVEPVLDAPEEFAAPSKDRAQKLVSVAKSFYDFGKIRVGHSGFCVKWRSQCGLRYANTFSSLTSSTKCRCSNGQSPATQHCTAIAASRRL